MEQAKELASPNSTNGQPWRISKIDALADRIMPSRVLIAGFLFAALLPQHPPTWYYFALPPLVFAVECGWYTVVALGFSSRGPREMYLRARKWVGRIAAGAIAGRWACA